MIEQQQQQSSKPSGELLIIDRVLALQQNRLNVNDLYNPTQCHSAKENN